MWPLRNVGSLSDEYSLAADQDNTWLTGGNEADVIAEAAQALRTLLSEPLHHGEDRTKRSRTSGPLRRAAVARTYVPAARLLGRVATVINTRSFTSRCRIHDERRGTGDRRIYIRRWEAEE